MSKKQIILYFLPGIIAGILISFFELRAIAISAFIVYMVIYYSYYFYIMLFTKSVNLVDKFVNRRKKHPLYSLLIALVNKELEEAEIYSEKLSMLYNQIKLSAKASILLEKKQSEEAAEIIQEIKNPNIRNFNLALLALHKEDFELFENYKTQVKQQDLRYALAAEAAYIRENLVEAERLGDLAISSSAGLQKWTFVKSLAYQRNNENRQSYF